MQRLVSALSMVDARSNFLINISILFLQAFHKVFYQQNVPEEKSREKINYEQRYIFIIFILESNSM